MRPITFAIILVGLVSLVLLLTSTNVFSLLPEQHKFINIDNPSNDIDCVACHSRIRAELDNSDLHGNFSCEDCHRFEGTGIIFAEGGSLATSGEEAHAAYTPRCLDCHDSDGATVAGEYATPARAFCDENYGCEYSAHKALVAKANESSMSVGENEACLVCHTNYSCELDYSYFKGISYNLSSWSFGTSFSYSGQRDYTANWGKSGAKHVFLSLDKIDCTKCHENIYEALVTGTNGDPDDYLTHAPIEISHRGSSGRHWDTGNPWGHDRYHYVPYENRAESVNNSYCYECHNVNKYADDNPSLPYDLASVATDTNSSNVHCAEALWCQTCHGRTKTKKVIDNPDYPSGADKAEGHSDTSGYGDFVDDVTSNYARTFQGDICMGCHEAAVHPSSGSGTEECQRCHGSNQTSGGNADVYIESEPSGYATNN